MAIELRALDLFCGAGGAGAGLVAAGFDVTGVDIRPQPRYPGRFIQADAMALPAALDPAQYDLIWASPPCQLYSTASWVQRQRGVVYPDLIAPVRAMLTATGSPFIIENVPGAPLRPDVVLDGWMFPQLRVVRERVFELGGWWCLAPPKTRPKGLLHRGYMSVAGNGTQGWAYKLGYRWSTDQMRAAMACPWMLRRELSQAIPPPYAEWLGRQFMNWRTRTAA